jgi:hypothetical protein
MILFMFPAALAASRRVRFEADPCLMVVHNSNCTAADDRHWKCEELNPTVDRWNCDITIVSIDNDNFTLSGTCRRSSGRPCDVYDINGYRMPQFCIDQCFYDCGLSVAAIMGIAAAASVAGILIVVAVVCCIGKHCQKFRCCRARPPGCDYANIDRDDVFGSGAFSFPPKNTAITGFERPQVE